MSNFDNGLSDAQTERLVKLAEECGEVVQAVAKILSHGYDSRNPLIKGAQTGRQNLVDELGDIILVVNMLTCTGDVNIEHIAERVETKFNKINRWLRHQQLQGEAGLSMIVEEY